MFRVLPVIGNQFVYTRIAKGRVGDEGFLEVPLDRDPPAKVPFGVEPPENASAEPAQVPRDVRVIEVDQPCHQLGIRWADVVVHPALNEVAQNVPVQIIVDQDHACRLNVSVVFLSWEDFFKHLEEICFLVLGICLNVCRL